MIGCSQTASLVLPSLKVIEQDDGTSVATFLAPIDRLEYDLWRAAKKQGWGFVYPLSQNEQGYYEGAGILDDSRKLTIKAWVDVNNHDYFHVQIKIGHFGAPKRQSQYLKQLKKVLDGKPMPKRGLNFDLNDSAKSTDLPTTQTPENATN